MPDGQSQGGTYRGRDGTEQCTECGEPPKGVTMAPGMDGWSCPFCGHYNQFDQSVGKDIDRDGGEPDGER
jgi:ribosomal protein S27AE